VKLHHIATGNHMPYGITLCCLPPGSGDFPAIIGLDHFGDDSFQTIDCTGIDNQTHNS